MFDKEKKVKKAVEKMNTHLMSKPDKNLIEGYKKAMNEYNKTEQEQHLLAAKIIKNELDRRGVKIEDSY